MRSVALRRWRGLKDLLGDAIEHGSRAVQRVHTETARRPFAVLEAIPLVAIPARGVHLVHDATVSAVYGLIRLVNRAVGSAAGAALSLCEPAAEEGGRLPPLTTPVGGVTDDQLKSHPQARDGDPARRPRAGADGLLR